MGIGWAEIYEIGYIKKFGRSIIGCYTDTENFRAIVPIYLKARNTIYKVT